MPDAQLSAEDAEEYTQALGQVAAGAWRQVALGHRLGVPQALGLTTGEWVERRLGGYVRLSVEARREAVQELVAPEEDGGQGMSNRQAAEVLGVAPRTVDRDADAAPYGAPDPMAEAERVIDQAAEADRQRTDRKVERWTKALRTLVVNLPTAEELLESAERQQQISPLPVLADWRQMAEDAAAVLAELRQHLTNRT